MKSKGKHNIEQNLHKSSFMDTAGFTGGSKLIMLIGTAVMAAALVVAVVPFMSGGEDKVIYSDAAVLANEQLKANNYSEAAELFKQAIEADPGDEELYIGLADSYNGMNESSLAHEALETGYAETGSETIKTELERLEENEVSLSEIENSSENSTESSAEAQAPAESSLESGEASQGGEKSSEASETVQVYGAVEVKCLESTDSNIYGDTEIFKSTVRWFELSSGESLDGIEKLNAAVKAEKDKYVKLDTSLYGAESEEKLYELVKAQGKEAEIIYSASVLCVSDYIISYSVDVRIDSPDSSYSSTYETFHTVNLKTGEEMELKDLIGGDEAALKSAVIKAFADKGEKLSDEDYDSISFYLDDDNLVFISPTGEIYISIAELSTAVSEYSSEEASKSETEQQ